MDLHLLHGVPDPAMHQLFAEFLRKRVVTGDDVAALGRIRGEQKARFVELARTVEENPADVQAVGAFLCYPVTAEFWDGVGCALGIEEGGNGGAGTL